MNSDERNENQPLSDYDKILDEISYSYEMQRLFFGALYSESSKALYSFSRMQDLLTTAYAEGQVTNPIAVWHYLDGILIAVNRLTRILWPAIKHNRCGISLRTDLEISDDLLCCVRFFRNNLEHYDERIHREYDSGIWAVDDLILPWDQNIIPKVSKYDIGPPTAVYSAIDANTLEYIYRDKTLNLPRMMGELREIAYRCDLFFWQHNPDGPMPDPPLSLA